MIRIIDDVAYEGKRSGQFKVKAVEAGQHIELSASRMTEWHELDWSPMSIQFFKNAVERHREETQEDRKKLCAKIAASRAKKNVRRLCKAMGADTLLTLTYRSLQTDLALCKRHLKEFVRRVMRVWPEFRAVAGFEEQKRGAWHVHLATVAVPRELVHRSGAKVKSYNLLRSIWRDVTKEHGGNVDVSKRKRNSKRSAAKIAAYLSKYITKDYEQGEKWSNRWTRFGDIEKPTEFILGLVNCPADMIKLCYDLCTGYEIADTHYSKWGDWFFIHAERGKT
jgi:hypothetical protein